MSGITIPGLMYLPPFGFTVANRSLAGRSSPLFPNRLLGLKGEVREAVPYVFRGDQLTWAVIEFLQIVWGDQETLRYASLQPDWKYEWNLNTKAFSVTNEMGQTTIHSDVATLTGLGISWEIFMSTQFWIYFDPNNGPVKEVFLISKRQDLNHYAEKKPFGSMDIDYLRGSQHAVFDFLSGANPSADSDDPDDPSGGPGSENPDNDNSSGDTDVLLVTLLGVAAYPDILLAYTNEINFINYYPIDLYPGEQGKAAERQRIQHQGYAQTISYLMIHMFASRLLSPLNSKIVYEPWMLWEMFKWFYVRPNAGTRDKIFDLSPWWG